MYDSMGDLVVSSTHPQLPLLASVAGFSFSTQHLNVGLPQDFPQISQISYVKGGGAWEASQAFVATLLLSTSRHHARQLTCSNTTRRAMLSLPGTTQNTSNPFTL